MLPIPLDRVRLWLDASDESTLTLDTDGRVTQWRDKGIGARHFNQEATYGRPLHVTGAVRFDTLNSNSTQNNPSAARLLSCPAAILNSYPIDVFAVVSNVTTPDEHVGPVIATRASGELTTYEFMHARGVIHRAAYVMNSLTLAADWSGGNAHLLHATLTGTQQRLRANILQQSSRDTGTRTPYQGISHLGAERPASSGYPAYQLRGDIHAVVVISSATDAERSAIGVFLTQQWDLLPLRVIHSRVIDIHTAGTPRGVLVDWDAPDRYVEMQIDSQGHWEEAFPSDIAFGAYYLSTDNRCPPIIHGPYTAE
jgi:hypothetical protein